MTLPEKVVKSIPKWKRKYGDVYFWEIGDHRLIYRGLTLGEFRYFSDISEKSDPLGEDFLLETAILWKDEDLDLDTAPVVAINSLIENILEATGITSLDTFKKLLNEARNYAQTAEGYSIAIICNAFGLDPDTVANFSLSKLTRYLALAEVVTGKKVEFEKPSRRRLGKRTISDPTSLPKDAILSKDAADIPNMTIDNAAYRKVGFYKLD